MPKTNVERYHDALADNDIESINRLMTDKDVEHLFTQPSECDKLLSSAIAHDNNIELVKLLLIRMGGIKKFAPNTLLFACKQGYIETVTLLLDKKAANLNTVTESGTALSCACMSGNEELVRLLLNRGIDPWFMQHEVLSPIVEHNENLLARFGSFRRHNVNPAINAACAKGHISIVELLVKQSKLIIFGFYESLDNPYTVAVMENQIDMLDYLLEHHPLDNQSKLFFIPFVCEANNPKIIPLLEKYNFINRDNLFFDTHRGLADMSLREQLLVDIVNYGSTALFKSLLELGHLDIDEPIGRNRQSALIIASSHGHVDLVEYLLQLGANPRATDTYGMNAFHAACREGRIDVVDCLLANGSFNIKAITQFNETALTLSFMNPNGNSLAIVDRLVMAGADCNHQNGMGQSALLLAVYDGSKDIVERLVSLNVDVNSADREGTTPLMLAVSTGLVEIVKLLLQQDTLNVALENSEGQTVFDIARDSENEDIRQLLDDYRQERGLSNGFRP